MSTFLVQSVAPEPSFTTSNGTFYPFRMGGILDGQVEANVTINTKDPARGPQIGQTIDCTVDRRDSHGIKIKKMQAPPSQPAPPYSTSAQAPHSQYREDPERHNGMAWGNAMNNAVALCVARAQYIGTPEDAYESLSTREIVLTATELYSSRERTAKEDEPLPEPPYEGVEE